MRRQIGISFLLAAVLAFAGCTTTPRTIMLGPARAAISPERVRLYNEPPGRRFQEIAMVEGRSVAELRTKAAALGANALIWGGIAEHPGPQIGIGIGGGSYSWGRHGGVGVDVGTGFGIPTGSSVIQATAIYLP